MGERAVRGFGFSSEHRRAIGGEGAYGDCDSPFTGSPGSRQQQAVPTDGPAGHQAPEGSQEAWAPSAEGCDLHRVVAAEDRLCSHVEVSPTGGLMPMVRKESRRTPRFWS